MMLATAGVPTGHSSGSSSDGEDMPSKDSLEAVAKGYSPLVNESTESLGGEVRAPIRRSDSGTVLLDPSRERVQHTVSKSPKRNVGNTLDVPPPLKRCERLPPGATIKKVDFKPVAENLPFSPSRQTGAAEPSPLRYPYPQKYVIARADSLFSLEP